MNCPGCKVEQAKETYRGLPIKNLLNVWMVTLCSSLPLSCLFPFIYFMVRDFGIARKETDISSYAGYVGSSFMVGRASTSLGWGIFADRYGRKYAIVVSLASVVVFNTLFGLSTSFWMAISTRFLLGCLNGSLGPIKAFATEIFREEHQALGLATVSSAWAIALVIGPALGGYLAQPVEKYPHVFSKGSLYDKFPYFLPCALISAVTLAALVACIWLPNAAHDSLKEALTSGEFNMVIMYRPGQRKKEWGPSVHLEPETLHNHNLNDESNEDAEAIETLNTIQRRENLLQNWPLMSNIIAYCVFSLHDTAYTEIFSLWVVSPLKLGGLNYTTNNVGNVFSIAGLSLVLYNIFIYPFLEKACGPLRLSHISAAISIPIMQSLAFVALISGFKRDLMITVASVVMICISASITTGLFLLQNRAVKQHQRGIANGIAMTGMSIFKAFGPVGGGAVLSWSQKRLHASFLPGPQMVFFVLNLIAALGVLMMFKPFMAEKKRTSSSEHF